MLDSIIAHVVACTCVQCPYLVQLDQHAFAVSEVAGQLLHPLGWGAPQHLKLEGVRPSLHQAAGGEGPSLHQAAGGEGPFLHQAAWGEGPFLHQAAWGEGHASELVRSQGVPSKFPQKMAAFVPGRV